MSRHWVMLGLVALVCLLSINTVVCEGGDLPGESVAEVHQDALDPLALDDEAEDAPENKPTDGTSLDAMSDEQKEVLTELSEIYEVQAEVGNTLPVLKEPNPSVDARKLRRGATHPGLPQDNTSADRRQLGGSKRGKKGRGRGGSP
uniref:Secreted protein n=1 Tax=Vitrella brassicaformis TaxID=1169539 RepID=A0A7S1PC95_9ALVE|mmetsp:Transcript_51033/g.128030  ORF Transcript_51033/g.128030 Transcript_51033/m.128030 type:complete len:146 (+) Transcript_51033:163-600(+)